MIFLVHARTGTVDSPAATASGTALASEAFPRPATDQRHVLLDHAHGRPALQGRFRCADPDACRRKRRHRPRKRRPRCWPTMPTTNGAAVTVRIGGRSAPASTLRSPKTLRSPRASPCPITLILLLLAFGSVVAALLPLGIASWRSWPRFAELNLLTHVTSVSIFAINLTTALGLGLGIDYALLMVSRFREELSPRARMSATRSRGPRDRRTHHRVLRPHRRRCPVGDAGLPGLLPAVVRLCGCRRTVFAAASALIVLPGASCDARPSRNAGRIPGVKTVRSPEAPFWGRLAAPSCAGPRCRAFRSSACCSSSRLPCCTPPSAPRTTARCPRAAPATRSATRSGPTSPCSRARSTPHPARAPRVGPSRLRPAAERVDRRPVVRRARPAASPAGARAFPPPMPQP